MTSRAKAEGRFGKADFVYLPEQDVYRCPSGEMLTYRYTNVEAGLTVILPLKSTGRVFTQPRSPAAGAGWWAFPPS